MAEDRVSKTEVSLTSTQPEVNLGQKFLTASQNLLEKSKDGFNSFWQKLTPKATVVYCTTMGAVHGGVFAAYLQHLTKEPFGTSPPLDYLGVSFGATAAIGLGVSGLLIKDAWNRSSKTNR